MNSSILFSIPEHQLKKLVNLSDKINKSIYDTFLIALNSGINQMLADNFIPIKDENVKYEDFNSVLKTTLTDIRDDVEDLSSTKDNFECEDLSREVIISEDGSFEI